MSIFSSVVFQIAVLFSFIFIGFVLSRFRILSKEAAQVFSRLENRILMPAVVIKTFWSNCTVENIREKWIFIVYSTAILIFCVIAGFIISNFLGKTDFLKRIYRYNRAEYISSNKFQICSGRKARRNFYAGLKCKS